MLRMAAIANGKDGVQFLMQILIIWLVCTAVLRKCRDGRHVSFKRWNWGFKRPFYQSFLLTEKKLKKILRGKETLLVSASLSPENERASFYRKPITDPHSEDRNDGLPALRVVQLGIIDFYAS